jgi:hypothetical protein
VIDGCGAPLPSGTEDQRPSPSASTTRVAT